ncbi:MAG: hypothetical protein ACK52I_12665 [Pseudomonadota bacterium]
MDKEEAYILSMRDVMLNFMHQNNRDVETSPCVVMGTIYAIMIFMQQTTEETEVAQAVREVTDFFMETSKQLLAVLPQPSEDAVMYHGPPGNA